MNYQEALKRLNGRDRRKLENNTVLWKRSDNTLAVSLHQTDIITLHQDGRTVLNSGGWRTATTKDRLNAYGPVRIWQDRGRWLFVGPDQKQYVFSDGLIISGNKCTAAEDSPKSRQADRKTQKEIDIYCREFAALAADGKIGLPGPGDCLICKFKTRNADHIISHIKEKYYVPQLLLNALEEKNAGTLIFRAWVEAAAGRQSEYYGKLLADYSTRALRRYIKARLVVGQ